VTVEEATKIRKGEESATESNRNSERTIWTHLQYWKT